MQVSCLQQNLSRGLAIVGRAVASRSNLPVLQNVKIVTDQGMLVLTATNLDIAITTRIGAQVEEEGELTIPARLLTDFVNSLPDDRIDIVSSEGSPAVSFKCQKFEANINGTSADDFPPIPEVDEESVHKKISSNKIQTEIVSGPAKGTLIIMVLNEKGDGTNISIDIELKLSLKAIILQPLIKKWYKRILTSTLYKINNSIMNNS